MEKADRRMKKQRRLVIMSAKDKSQSGADGGRSSGP
jgi:hypothetical protein